MTEFVVRDAAGKGRGGDAKTGEKLFLLVFPLTPAHVVKNRNLSFFISSSVFREVKIKSPFSNVDFQRFSDFRFFLLIRPFGMNENEGKSLKLSALLFNTDARDLSVFMWES